MEIHARQLGSITLLTLQGSLDDATASRAAALIHEQVAGGHVCLVADFRGVKYTSSAGLRVLLTTVKETRLRGGDIRLAAVQPNVHKFLTMSGFTNILQLFDTVEEALASFSQKQES